ncbi:ABC transporter substrate-binding protein [Roseibium salinum]|uniref:ABC transporter substrate-binding protein n=1 Tax=Roseibium salinum TaxID=1604349 RepID=UPI00361B9B82
METNLKPVIAGFIPLLDSAVLVAASELGFAEREGVALKLVRETSWANIRDRIAVGHFDIAHMLAPMPIAASLNLTSLSVPMLAPMLLGLGGNAITVAAGLWKEMAAAGADPGGDPASTGRALGEIITLHHGAGAPPLRFGVVHPFSGHAYELRYWLAATGIDPDKDVEITVLAPQLMADALAAGQLDGYCVGEPWNTAAVAAGTGRIATYKQAIWPDSPEKVLGVTEMGRGQSGHACGAGARLFRCGRLVRRARQRAATRRTAQPAGPSRLRSGDLSSCLDRPNAARSGPAEARAGFPGLFRRCEGGTDGCPRQMVL